MGQVAFDTQEFVETLEKSGLKKEQAKAISLVVRKSHEVSDIATKTDIIDVKRDIADVRKDMEFGFEKNDAKISLVRKDLQLEMAGIRSEQKLIRWMLSALIAGVASLIIKAFFVASV